MGNYKMELQHMGSLYIWKNYFQEKARKLFYSLDSRNYEVTTLRIIFPSFLWKYVFTCNRYAFSCLLFVNWVLEYFDSIYKPEWYYGKGNSQNFASNVN